MALAGGSYKMCTKCNIIIEKYMAKCPICAHTETIKDIE